MKTTVTFYTFRDLFREIRPGNFSSEGLACLFDYFEQYEADTGEEMELDVIAICCDFSEDTWQAIAENYDIDLSECADDEEKQEAVREFLKDEGLVGEPTPGTFVYRNV